MCFDVAHGGELLSLINRNLDRNLEIGVQNVACDITTTRFYIAEIIEALEYLHSFEVPIIHRDLKPESKYRTLLQEEDSFLIRTMR